MPYINRQAHRGERLKKKHRVVALACSACGVTPLHVCLPNGGLDQALVEKLAGVPGLSPERFPRNVGVEERAIIELAHPLQQSRWRRLLPEPLHLFEALACHQAGQMSQIPVTTGV